MEYYVERIKELEEIIRLNEQELLDLKTQIDELRDYIADRNDFDEDDNEI